MERFIIVFFPFSKYKRINNRNKSFIIAFLLILALSLYVFVPFANGLERTESPQNPSVITTQCLWLRWLHLAQNFILIETLLTIFVPFIIIFLINMLISAKLINDSIVRRKQKLTAGSSGASTTGTNNSLEESLTRSYSRRNTAQNFQSGGRFSNFNPSTLSRRKRTYLRTSRNLIFILTVFLLLNTPLVYSNICVLLIEYIKMSRLDQIISFFSRDLFYLNFSINFFLYAFDRSQLKFSRLFCFCKKN
jgi:hypothetical protein